MNALPIPVEQWARVEWDGGSARVLFARDRKGRMGVAAIALSNPTPEGLRRVPLIRIENAARTLAASVQGGESFLSVGTLKLGSKASESRRYKLTRPAGRRLDDAFYVNVGRAYRSAVQHGLEPRKTIASDAGVADATAAGWIMGARKRHRLPPAEPGKVSV